MSHRFYLPPHHIAGNQASLTADQRKQIRNVLRLQPMDTVTLFDGTGKEYEARIQSLSPESAEVLIISESTPATEDSLKLTLVQCLPKGEKLDLILQKCTELGIAKIMVAESCRCVAKVPKEKAQSRRERWSAIVREASEQSGRVCIPEVTGVLSFSEALMATQHCSVRFIAWECEANTSLISKIAKLDCNSEVAIFIGPEGGFSADEVNLAKQSGVIPVSLGPRILRTETAAIFCTAMLIYTHP